MLFTGNTNTSFSAQRKYTQMDRYIETALNTDVSVVTVTSMLNVNSTCESSGWTNRLCKHCIQQARLY